MLLVFEVSDEKWYLRNVGIHRESKNSQTTADENNNNNQEHKIFDKTSSPTESRTWNFQLESQWQLDPRGGQSDYQVTNKIWLVTALNFEI